MILDEPSLEHLTLGDETIGDATVREHRLGPSVTQDATSTFTYKGSMPAAEEEPVMTSSHDKVKEEDTTSNSRMQDLRMERDRLRLLNNMLEKTIGNFQSAQDKLQVSLCLYPFYFTLWKLAVLLKKRFQGNVETTHALMDIYVKLVSQAEHNSQLLLDGHWTIDGDLAQITKAQQKEAEEARLAQELVEKQEQDRKRAQEVSRTKEADLCSASEKKKGILSKKGRNI